MTDWNLQMNYEDEVIESARKGLTWANVALTPEMEKLFRVIYKAGYNKGKIDTLMPLEKSYSQLRDGHGN